MLLIVHNDLRIEREKRNVSPFYEVRIPYEAEILSGGNICREAFMAKHREFWKNKDPQLSIQARLHCLVLAAVHKVLKDNT